MQTALIALEVGETFHITTAARAPILGIAEIAIIYCRTITSDATVTNGDRAERLSQLWKLDAHQPIDRSIHPTLSEYLASAQ